MMQPTNTKKPADIPSYIAAYPPAVQDKLQALWQVIREIVPQATEKIAYGMPAFSLHGPLVYFAGYKNHIGFYPMPAAITEFARELSAYASSKGAVQFPLDQPLPLPLIKRILRYRVKQNQEAAKQKASSKTKPAATQSSK